MLDGWVGDGWVGRVRGTKAQFRGYLGEALMNPRRSVSTLSKRQRGCPHLTQEGILFTFRHFLEDSHRLYPQITDCTPKLHIVPHSRFLPRKKRLWGMGYGVQFSVHPINSVCRETCVWHLKPHKNRARALFDTF